MSPGIGSAAARSCRLSHLGTSDRRLHLRAHLMTPVPSLLSSTPRFDLPWDSQAWSDMKPIAQSAAGLRTNTTAMATTTSGSATRALGKAYRLIAHFIAGVFSATGASATTYWDTFTHAVGRSYIWCKERRRGERRIEVIFGLVLGSMIAIATLALGVLGCIRAGESQNLARQSNAIGIRQFCYTGKQNSRPPGG